MDDFYKTWDVDVEDGSTDKKALYDAMLARFDQSSPDVGVCWRMVEVCIVMADGAEKVKDKSQAEKYIQESHKYAKLAIEHGPKVMDAHKWYCAAVGRLADHVGIKERIKCGYEFKEHHDIAVKLNDNDDLMHHMYGRWCYEVASLSIIERTIADTFFATPPTSSYEEALASLLKAEKLSPEWRLNKVWVAKVYIAMKNYKSAIKFIDEGLALPNKTEEDGVADIDLKQLEKKYGNYRNK